MLYKLKEVTVDQKKADFTGWEVNSLNWLVPKVAQTENINRIEKS